MALRIVVISFFATVLLLACGKGYKKADSGLQYKFYIQNQGVKKPNVGEVLHINYTVQNSEGDQIFSTYVQRQGLPEVIILEKSHYPGDYFEALSLMSVGDSATFLIDADKFYDKYLKTALPKNIKKGSNLILTVRLIDVLSQEQSEEIKNKEKFAKYEAEYKIIDNYITASNKPYKTTEEGIKYIITGTQGKTIENGDIVKFNYRGKLLNDEEFISSYASNSPGELEVGKDYEIEFYNMVLPLLSKGQKGEFVIPFVYAYGEKGVAGKVPAFAPVLYEIEIIDVQKNSNNKNTP